MPAPILHVDAFTLCSHLGRATPMAPFPRVMVAGKLVVPLTSPYGITNCGLSTTPTPPCVTGQFLSGAARVLVGGVPVVTLTNSSMCVPTGTSLVTLLVQLRVLAT